MRFFHYATHDKLKPRIFTARRNDALAIAFLYVRPSVCRSQAGIVSKRVKIQSSLLDSAMNLVFGGIRCTNIFTKGHP